MKKVKSCLDEHKEWHMVREALKAHLVLETLCMCNLIKIQEASGISGTDRAARILPDLVGKAKPRMDWR